jgi:hypothetical protein
MQKVQEFQDQEECKQESDIEESYHNLPVKITCCEDGVEVDPSEGIRSASYDNRDYNSEPEEDLGENRDTDPVLDVGKKGTTSRRRIVTYILLWLLLVGLILIAMGVAKQSKNREASKSIVATRFPTKSPTQFPTQSPTVS